MTLPHTAKPRNHCNFSFQDDTNHVEIVKILQWYYLSGILVSVNSCLILISSHITYVAFVTPKGDLRE